MCEKQNKFGGKITPGISKFMAVYNIQPHKSSYIISKFQRNPTPIPRIAADGGVLVENTPIKTLQKPLSQGPKTK